MFGVCSLASLLPPFSPTQFADADLLDLVSVSQIQCISYPSVPVDMPLSFSELFFLFICWCHLSFQTFLWRHLLCEVLPDQPSLRLSPCRCGTNLTSPLGSVFQTEARIVKCFPISRELAVDRDPLFHQSHAPELGNA